MTAHTSADVDTHVEWWLLTPVQMLIHMLNDDCSHQCRCWMRNSDRWWMLMFFIMKLSWNHPRLIRLSTKTNMTFCETSETCLKFWKTRLHEMTSILVSSYRCEIFYYPPPWLLSLCLHCELHLTPTLYLLLFISRDHFRFLVHCKTRILLLLCNIIQYKQIVLQYF